MRMRAALGSLLMLLAACTPTHDPDPLGTSAIGASSAEPGNRALVRCEDLAGTLAEPGDGYVAVAGSVALPTRVLEPVESGEADPALRLWAKWGLGVRAGVAVDIEVDGEVDTEVDTERAAARIGWGNPPDPAHAVHVPACPSSSDGWLFFAGGMWVAEPACVPLIIRVGDQREKVGIGVGMPCNPAASRSPTAPA